MSKSSTGPIQINTDISPIISPTSGISGSFISPRDNLLLNFNTHKMISTNNQSDYNQLRLDHIENHEQLEGSNKINDSATNESYSIDRSPLEGKCFLILPTNLDNGQNTSSPN